MQIVVVRSGRTYKCGSNYGLALEAIGYASDDAFGLILRKLASNPEERIETRLDGKKVEIRIERVGDWVQTFSGGRWWPHDPRPEEVRIEDAPQLAHVNRYGGATIVPLSVMQHSCLVHDLVARWGGTPKERRDALFHDWHEMYPPGDQLRPAMVEDGLSPEQAAGVRALRTMLSGSKRAVREAFGLSATMPEIVKRADNVALATERKFLLREVPWEHGKLLPPEPSIRGIPWWDANLALRSWNKRNKALEAELAA